MKGQMKKLKTPGVKLLVQVISLAEIKDLNPGLPSSGEFRLRDCLDRPVLEQ